MAEKTTNKTSNPSEKYSFFTSTGAVSMKTEKINMVPSICILTTDGQFMLTVPPATDLPKNLTVMVINTLKNSGKDSKYNKFQKHKGHIITDTLSFTRQSVSNYLYMCDTNQIKIVNIQQTNGKTFALFYEHNNEIVYSNLFTACKVFKQLERYFVSDQESEDVGYESVDYESDDDSSEKIDPVLKQLVRRNIEKNNKLTKSTLDALKECLIALNIAGVSITPANILAGKFNKFKSSIVDNPAEAYNYLNNDFFGKL